MRNVYVIIVFAFIQVSWADIIRASYGKDVVLPAEYNNDNPFSVDWVYRTDSGSTDIVISQVGESGTPNIGDNFTGRVELDYSTAYLNISQLQCWDDKIYECTVGLPFEEAARHTLLLGTFPYLSLSFISRYVSEKQNI